MILIPIDPNSMHKSEIGYKIFCCSKTLSLQWRNKKNK